MHIFPSAPHPIAFAALPWQLVMAIIVFNIVAGMISKRKQRQAKSNSKTNPQAGAAKAEARRDKDESRDGEIRRSLEESRVREAQEAKKKAAERRARQAREEVLRARDEARLSDEPADEAETRGTIRPAQARPEAAKPARKGLLDQLARELGLELPRSPEMPPAPSRAPMRPVEAQSTRPQAEPSEGADHRPIPAATSAPVPAPMSQALVGPGDFSDPEAMRKAFILKVILDKPLALRHRR